MPHPYPPHLQNFPYIGRYRYSLEFTTFGRCTIFRSVSDLDLVLPQILRAAREQAFVITAYCFMPDHVHLIVEGATDGSNCKAFIKSAKQFSGYYFTKARASRLWDRYGYERFIRDEMELALTIRYVLANPVRAGLVLHPSEYGLLGSERYRVEELIQMSDYSERYLLD
jgi:putative transposase